MANNQHASLITLNAQYLKDLSFESPGAPSSLVREEAPPIDVQLDVQVDSFEDNLYEVTLVINVEAKEEDNTIFVLETIYSGLFTVQAEDEVLEKVLLIECPALLFPFARRIIANVSQDGGLPPLMLSPIDFAELYSRKKNGDIAEED